jgi:hypothetical protein
MTPPYASRWLVTAQRFGDLRRYFIYCGGDGRAAQRLRALYQESFDHLHPDEWWLVSVCAVTE